MDFFTTAISCEEIDNIKKTMYEHKDLFSMKEETNAAFLETPNSPYKESILPYKGKEILIVYDKISKILMDNGVDEMYLKLRY